MFIIPLSQLPSVFSQGTSTGAATQQNSVPFVDVLRESIANMRELRAKSDQDSVDLALGNMDDLHTMGINATKAAAATTFTTQLATRAISAYNEIIRMQI